MANESSSENVQSRVDPSHAVSPVVAKSAAKVAAGEALPLSAPGPLEGHAEQLATWLQKQQRDLEQRSTLIQTQEADLDQKVQAAQKWLEEQRQQIEQRETDLERQIASLGQGAPSREAEQALALREQELDARQARLDDETESLIHSKASIAERSDRIDARDAELTERRERLEKTSQAMVQEAQGVKQSSDEAKLKRSELEQLQEQSEAALAELAERERRIDLRQQEIETAIQRYERLGVAEERVATLQAEVTAIATREHHLSKAETLLAEERSAFADSRKRLIRAEREHNERASGERKSLDSDRAAWRTEVKSVAKQNDHREAQQDRREESLQRLQRELQASQREVLEMRLATEETWAQLTGLLTPAALTKSIATVRVRLADHYSHTLQDIADGRGALRDASKQVAEELRLVEERQIMIEEWANRRHEELGEAASRMEAREHELNRQQRAFEQFEARWATERSDYREQIRLLLAELRTDEAPVKLAAAA